MSYRTVKNGLANIIAGLGYAESNQSTKQGSSAYQELRTTFTILALSGQLDEGPTGNSETLSDRFYDVQEWQITLAIPSSGESEVESRDQILSDKDAIINAIDKPLNWSSYVRIQKYLGWELEERPGYFLLHIKIKIVDTYIYT